MNRKAPSQDIFLVGQMTGMAARLNIPELEKYLDSKPTGFHYIHWCRAAIAFAKAVSSTSSDNNQ